MQNYLIFGRNYTGSGLLTISETAQWRKGPTAQRRKGAMAQWHHGSKAPRRKGEKRL